MIIRDGKRLDRLDASKIKTIQREENKDKHIYNGELQAYLVLEDTRIGDIIEYSFTIHGQNPLYQGKFFATHSLRYYDPINQINYRIICPKNRTLYFKYFNGDFTPEITETSKEKVYKWYYENVKGIQQDAEVPSWYSAYPKFEVSEFASWSEFKLWALKIFKYPVQDDKDLNERIEQIKSTYSTAERRLEAALKLVQNEIRYTGMEGGIGGYQPESPKKVFNQRFGDCKGKSLLLCYMLAKMDVEAYPTLVSTVYGKESKNHLPSPFVFNHCVVQVRIGGQAYWYDATAQLQRGKFNSIYFPDYESAMVLREDDALFTDIKFTSVSKSRITEDFLISRVGGSVDLTVETEYFGAEADIQRLYFSQNLEGEIGKNYLNYYAKNYPDIAILDSITYEDNEEENIFTTKEKYVINDFWIPVDTVDSNNIQAGFYAQFLRDKIYIPTSNFRTMPLALSYPIDVEHIIKIHLPEAWSVQESSNDINAPGIKYRDEITYNNDIISISYHYQTLQSYIEGKDTKELIKSLNKIVNNLGYSLTYNVNTTAAAGSDVNYIMVFLGGIFLVISGFILYNVYKYDPFPKYSNFTAKEYNGWMMLFIIIQFASIIIMAKNLYKLDYFNLDTWQGITNPSSTSYSPALAILWMVEYCFNILIFMATLLLIYLFFNKRSSFVAFVTWYYVIDIAFVTLDMILINSISPDIPLDTQSVTEIVKLICGAVIWLSYFHSSNDVKFTFVNTIKDRQVEDDVNFQELLSPAEG